MAIANLFSMGLKTWLSYFFSRAGGRLPAEYCRQKGIYPHQLEQWRRACENANDWDRQSNIKLKTEQKTNQKRIRDLKKELQRKDKALAEAAALLVLQKKVQAIWGESEDE